MAVTGTAVNVWASRIIPAVLLGIIGYVSWVITRPVAVQYLLTPPTRSPRVGAGVVVLVLYWIFMILMTWSFLRLLFEVAFDPGLIKTQAGQKITKYRSRPPDDDPEAQTSSDPKRRGHLRAATRGFWNRLLPVGRSRALYELEDFYTKDVFVCDDQGMPKWCSTCKIYRPDRARHCREIDRCVRRMDHFCPWMGGLVSETSNKFFIQFNAYTVLYCVFIIIIMGVFTDGVRERPDVYILAHGHWIAVLAMGIFFFLLTLETDMTAVILAVLNLTTPENIRMKTAVWQLAVRVPDGFDRSGLKTVSFPSGTLRDPEKAGNSEGSEATEEDKEEGDERALQTADDTHLFAILQSEPGDNPWDIGRWQNFTQMMGKYPWNWLLPMQHSPFCNPDEAKSRQCRPEMALTSFFVTGIDVQAMRARAGMCELTEQEWRLYEQQKAKRLAFPNWIAGAGAPVKMWQAYFAAKKK
ncbi:hypothetical protein KC349_g5969 [Hortaea werneckii]|nr:hypothetical protein KC349_g5969 [Hortaea werneckii]